MSTMFHIMDTAVNLPGLDIVGVDIKTPKDMDANTGTNLYVSIRNFIMPFLLIAIAAISVTFLVRRQMSQFLQFIAISIAVIALVYSPQIIEAAAKMFANFFG